MAAEKSPAFQFYPKDFLMDGNVAGMSLQERGAYITLLCICWQEQSLPNDQGRLARMVGVPLPVFRRLWPALVPCFQITAGRLTHKRLEIERQKQDAFRRRQRENGAKGGRPKPDTNPDETHGLAEPNPEQSSALSDLPSSSPVSEGQEQQQRGRPRHQPVEHPDDNIGVITKIAHEVIDLMGPGDGDLVEAVKGRCARLHIDYNSAAVLKALDSARVQRSIQ